jgi:transcriptional regulator of acetoin/glycerol metabolism
MNNQRALKLAAYLLSQLAASDERNDIWYHAFGICLRLPPLEDREDRVITVMRQLLCNVADSLDELDSLAAEGEAEHAYAGEQREREAAC